MASVNGKSWTFAQLSGNMTVLELSGWQAPFGRPRQGTIVNTGLSVRNSVTYYPDAGAAVPPTVHVFGTEPKPFELHGRWMDAAIAASGGARLYQRQWRDFVGEKQLVRAKWGDILSYQILIHDIDLNLESEAHLAWKLAAHVIVDEQAPVAVYDTPAKNPADMADDIRRLANKATPSLAVQLRALQGQVADFIDQLTFTITDPIIHIWDTANALSDFLTAPVSDLVVMGTALNTVKAAFLNIRDLTTDFVSGAAFQNVATIDQNGIFSAADVTDLSAGKIDSDLNIDALLTLVADMSREIEIAQRGQQSSAHVGQENETWESIATRQYGDPSAAQAVRDANHVKYGQRVQIGKNYQIPRRV